MSLSVGVFGATGYAGREILRILSAHPEARVAFATGSGPGYLAHEEALGREADAYLLALPHGISGGYVDRLHQERADATIIDLSGDLRLPDAASYQLWYGHEPPAARLLGTVPYGLSEVYREQLAGAHVIANPGCYATSVLLPLVPLLREGLVEADDVVVDAKSGATGAGRTPREDLLFCEVADDISAYSPGRQHRHVGEIEAVVKEQTGVALGLTFCPHLLPVKRGILSAVYVKSRASAQTLADALRAFYRECPFVGVLDSRPPRLSDVVGTNACLMSVHEAAAGRLVVFSAIDNLVKGAAGQAVQNLNLARGWPEGLGLRGAVAS